MQRLLPTGYFHVVFTVPDPLLNGLALRNRERFFRMLFAAASECLLDLGSDPKRLGGLLGITAVLHTWTRDLRFHPHLHCIVTGGGLNPEGNRWLKAREGYLFPVKVLSRLFRGKLVAALTKAYEAGELDLGGGCCDLADPKAFARLKDKLYKADWVTFAKKPFAGPGQVFSYLGRYTHRVGISNQRLVAMDDGGIHFRTRGEKTATLEPKEFIGRFLQHVLPPGFVKIRHFGLLAPGNVNTKLVVARRLLEAEQPDLPFAVAVIAGVILATRAIHDVEGLDGWRLQMLRLTGVDVTRCRKCGVGTMIALPLPTTPRGLSTTAAPDDTS